MAIVRWVMLMVALLRDAAAVAARRKVEDSMVEIYWKIYCGVSDEMKVSSNYILFGAMLTSLALESFPAENGHVRDIHFPSSGNFVPLF